MLISACPTCNRVLSHIQIPFEKYENKILSDPKLSHEEKESLISKFILSYNLGICCNMRIKTYLRVVDIVKTITELEDPMDD